MISLCDYCLLPIEAGQRFKVYASGPIEDGETVQVKAVYHINCDKLRRREVGQDEPEGKYGTITASKKKFHPGEPIFLIRATDPLAPHAVLDYARRCVESGCDKNHVDAAFDHAMRIGEWQRNNPELVKGLPD